VLRMPDREVRWERVPWVVIGQLLEIVAESLQVPPSELTAIELERPLDILQGQSLSGLISYCKKHPERPDSLSTMEFVKRQSGRYLAGRNGERRHILIREMFGKKLDSQVFLSEMLVAFRGRDVVRSSMELVEPLLRSVARIYPLAQSDLAAECSLILLEELEQITFAASLHRRERIKRMLWRVEERIFARLEVLMEEFQIEKYWSLPLVSSDSNHDGEPNVQDMLVSPEESPEELLLLSEEESMIHHPKVLLRAA
jgi:hypothetical protein